MRVVLDLLDQFTNTSSQRVSQQNVAIQVLECQCPPRSALIARDLIRHGLQRVAPFYRFQQRVFAPFFGSNNGCPVLSWSGFGFVWLGTFGLLNNLSIRSLNNFWTQFFHPVMHASRRSWEEAEVTHTLSRIRLLQFPSEQLSGYNKLEVFREEWKRSIVFDRTSILSSEHDWYRPNTPCLDVSSTLHAYIVHDAVHSSRSYQDPLVFVHGIHKQKQYSLSVAQNLTFRFQSRIDDGM